MLEHFTSRTIEKIEWELCQGKKFLAFKFMDGGKIWVGFKENYIDISIDSPWPKGSTVTCVDA